MAIAIYTDSSGRRYYADTQSRHTQDQLTAGLWSLFDSTPEDPPIPPLDGLDQSIAQRVGTPGSATRVALGAAFGTPLSVRDNGDGTATLVSA